MRPVCPRCGSDSVRCVSYMGVNCIICLKCGYDERDHYDVCPDQKPDEPSRGPYKTGGHRRTIG